MSIPKSLFKSAIPVKLPPQPLKLLVLLASRSGQVVTRNEIQEQLWVGETFVDFEHGVNKCINQIRTALGDNADNPVYVETLPRRGYRFVAPVVSKTIPAPQPKVIESDSGERSRLPVLIGGRTKAAAAVAEVAADSLPAVVPDARTAAEPATEPHLLKRHDLDGREPVSRGSVATVLLVAAAGGGLYWRWHAQGAGAHRERHDRAGRLRQQDGRPGIRRHVEAGAWPSNWSNRHSSSLISQGKVNQTLKLMDRPADAALTPEDCTRGMPAHGQQSHADWLDRPALAAST